MQIQPVINAVQAALASQGPLAGGDAAVEEAIEHLTTALGPALRQAALELAEQAACEVRAQLPDRTVDVVLADGEPTLRIAEAPAAPDPAATGSPEEDLDARITLRLTPTLKALIEDAAETAGASVNGWVADALARRTRTTTSARGVRMTQSFDL